jgi:hypothetical protein
VSRPILQVQTMFRPDMALKTGGRQGAASHT